MDNLVKLNPKKISGKEATIKYYDAGVSPTFSGTSTIDGYLVVMANGWNISSSSCNITIYLNDTQVNYQTRPAGSSEALMSYICPIKSGDTYQVNCWHTTIMCGIYEYD